MIEIESPGLLLPGDFVVQTPVGFRMFCAQIVTSADHDGHRALAAGAMTQRLQTSSFGICAGVVQRMTHDARTSTTTAWRP